MIVMKFGGSSLRSAATFQQVASIIQSNTHRQPVIVASAMGDTTDNLQSIAHEASTSNAYRALSLLDTLKNDHFAAAEALLQGARYASTETYFRKTFRDLHVRILEVCEGERALTPELQDWILSLGEQLSSRLLATVLAERCGSAVHLDSRRLILTNDNFTDAEPLYWETYARIRWSIPILARDKLVVLGGFIGSTEDGRTTTLGRGGSDLTASIVGAAINADEIQVWKDVAGMLTCDPRIFSSGLQVRQLSYREAAALAQSGATILHPKTMEPAKRLRIPIVIRNTFHPAGEETRIESADKSADVVKSMAVKENVTLLAISPAGDRSDVSLRALCDRLSAAADVLYSSESIAYVAAGQSASMPETVIPAAPCLEVRVRNRQAIVTLVGHSLKDEIQRRITAVLTGVPHLVLPAHESDCSVKLAISQDQLKRSVQRLHAAFFSNPDPHLFVRTKTNAVSRAETAVHPRKRSQQRTVPAGAEALQLN